MRYYCRALATLLLFVTAFPTTTWAADAKTKAGAWLILGGAGLTAAAFDYGRKCPDGCRDHRVPIFSLPRVDLSCVARCDVSDSLSTRH